MTFSVKNTEANFINAEANTLRGDMTFKVSKSGKMLIIEPATQCFPYLINAKQFRKALSF